MEKKNIIIGSSISGLIAARILNQNQIPFIGLERETSLFSSIETGQQRLLTENAVKFIQQFAPIVDWERIDEAPCEIKKGEYSKLSAGSLEGHEKIYLKEHFFYPKVSFLELVQKIADPVEENFLTSKNVTEILASEKKVICQDGSEYVYDNLYWCADLSSLLRICKQGKSTLKTSKKFEDSKGVINLFWETEPLITNKNSVTVSFRYKDYKLKAIGLADPLDHSQQQHLHWVLPIERELAEDREEIAKCVRTLKRELYKEFPEGPQKITKEKIVFNPTTTDDLHIPAKSLEVFEGVLYLGPNLSVKSEETEDASGQELSGLDLALVNCKSFQTSLNTAQN